MSPDPRTQSGTLGQPLSREDGVSVVQIFGGWYSEGMTLRIGDDLYTVLAVGHGAAASVHELTLAKRMRT